LAPDFGSSPKNDQPSWILAVTIAAKHREAGVRLNPLGVKGLRLGSTRRRRRRPDFIPGISSRSWYNSGDSRRFTRTGRNGDRSAMPAANQDTRHQELGDS
jgi:hypothetical protein